MINYRREGLLPAKPHSVLPNPDGGIYFEQCFTREGFDGPFSILYHRYPSQFHGQGTAISPLWEGREEVAGGPLGPLRRQHFRTQSSTGGGTPTTGRNPLLFNDDLTIGWVRPTQEDDFYFANGDGEVDDNLDLQESRHPQG